MARCGCSGSCGCSVAAGPGVTVTGNGSASNPYVITAGGAVDCEVIQDCVGGALGDGLEYDDAANEIRARISALPGNAATIGADGGIYAAGGGGGGGLTVVSTQATPCITLAGQGTPGSPLSANPVVDPTPGNLASCTANGLRAALTVGACGLTGNGSPASPLAARVQAWPHACDVTANAGGVYCDADGMLRSEPRGRATFVQDHVNQTFAATPVPGGADNVVATRNLLVTNPDPCREAFCIFEVEVDVDFDLPANSGAEYGIATDAMYYVANRGSTAITDAHVQTTKVYHRSIPPGGNLNEPLDITLGRGSGGASYNRLQSFMRAWVFNL